MVANEEGVPQRLRAMHCNAFIPLPHHTRFLSGEGSTRDAHGSKHVEDFFFASEEASLCYIRRRTDERNQLNLGKSVRLYYSKDTVANYSKK